MIPLAWRAGAAVALLASLFAAGYVSGHKRVKAEWARADAAQLEADNKAVITRWSDNAKLAEKHAADNAAITKAHDDEISTLRARLAAAGRMRVPAFCGGSAAPTNPESPGSGHAVDPGERLLPDRVEQDIRALIMQSEEVAAAGRACQAFVRANGMAP